ncbi:hypothetical protein LEP1GSC058_3558 [Leptospira fainei serovar Hurstbridge str. BUT 6]|uniref:Uncharacterized protein n=1 Tax=Leptospira fainei serovar Hurstbridge str. BUT 6 TaxID=1193011 RepID=S3W239_9LEPT|nr:hypothetical protein LEP1GSC058_3558 [Leptospira fainei serovar Hurstbridge str. BUT 6]
MNLTPEEMSRKALKGIILILLYIRPKIRVLEPNSTFRKAFEV